MPKKVSKTKVKTKATAKASKSSSKFASLWRKVKRRLSIWKQRIHDFRAQHYHPHKSFHRSYREDYVRKTETPGLLSHAMLTFKEIFKHWKTFGLLIVLMTVLYITCVGLMSEDFYRQFQDSIDQSSAEIAGGEIGNFAKAGLLLLSTVTSGGLDSGMGDVQTFCMILLFLILWLVTIFLLRHFFAGESPKLRDGLYNALGPLLSTLLVFVVIFIQLIPAMLAIITYSAAILTDFLSTPFYALLYFCFAALMLLISGYLLSSSLMALVAVTAPGMYPMRALFAASDLMMGRRIKLIIRVIYLFFVVALIYIITMLPIILLDLLFKNSWGWLTGVPIVPFFMLIVTCFVFIYFTTYLYMYYRWLLDNKED